MNRLDAYLTSAMLLLRTQNTLPNHINISSFLVRLALSVQTAMLDSRKLTGIGIDVQRGASGSTGPAMAPSAKLLMLK